LKAIGAHGMMLTPRVKEAIARHFAGPDRDAVRESDERIQTSHFGVVGRTPWSAFWDAIRKLTERDRGVPRGPGRGPGGPPIGHPGAIRRAILSLASVPPGRGDTRHRRRPALFRRRGATSSDHLPGRTQRLKRPRTAAECTDAPDILRLTTKQTGGITQMTPQRTLQNVKLFLRASLAATAVPGPPVQFPVR
jgi:hypothetical protein